VLAEFVPDPKQATRVIKDRVCLVDGTITPCWSYAEHRELWSRKHGTTGFCVQLIGLLDGTPIWVSDPLPGNTHDKTAFDTTANHGHHQESEGRYRNSSSPPSKDDDPGRTPRLGRTRTGVAPSVGFAHGMLARTAGPLAEVDKRIAAMITMDLCGVP
jgi:DDE superfamily endonuclease